MTSSATCKTSWRARLLRLLLMRRRCAEAAVEMRTEQPIAEPRAASVAAAAGEECVSIKDASAEHADPAA